MHNRSHNAMGASNQESVRKASSRLRMPRVTHVGKPAKITKGPAKKIGKEK